MSTTSTPSRTRPALVIPGIDSRPHYDGKPSMISCHGLPTPPQSALENRRPSLQFSTMAEYDSSAGTTVGPFSQPSTPVAALSRHGESYGYPWTEHAATATNTPSNLVHSLPSTHLIQSLLQPAFQSQQAYQAPDVGCLGQYADGTSPHTSNSFAPQVDASPQNAWTSSQHVSQSCAGDVSSGLGPPLFAMSHAFDPENRVHDPLDLQSGSTYHHQQLHPSVQSFHGYGTVQDNMYNHPQVVVPSQLSPQDDFTHQQYHALICPDHAAPDYSTSFGSSAGGLDDFEMIRPPSPTSAYFAQSDEEDYIHVKFERDSPSYYASLRRSTSSRSRRRGSRRPRTSGANFSHIHRIGNTEVVCENFNPTDGIPVRSKGRDKQHRCMHKLDNGLECGVSFDRSEHLKRHALMHSDVRNYPCPLPKCPRKIQRPDNAADHFKTHLKPNKKGKRNDHFDWPFVRRAILVAYLDQKRANKLIDNLQKWVDAGMPECASQRRGARE